MLGVFKLVVEGLGRVEVRGSPNVRPGDKQRGYSTQVATIMVIDGYLRTGYHYGPRDHQRAELGAF
jgi:hypothetical protein